jgi:hypothetical protein
MKDGFVLLVIGVVGIVGLLMWRADIDPFHPGHYFSHMPEPRASTEPDVPPPPPVAAPRKAAHVHVAIAPEPAPVVEVTPAPVVVETPAAPERVAVQRDPPPFPAVDQIASGAPEETVTGKFGDPAISALTSTGGHILGTYVYARQGGRVATVIHLEDGKVASATSKELPPPAGGLSIPRPKRPE